MGGVTRVMIVDDEELVRVGLRSALADEADIEVVGEARDGIELLERVGSLSPDIVLLDLRMPRLDGFGALERLAHQPDAPKVIILTTFDLDDHVARAMRLGAVGFMIKATAPSDLATAVRAAAAGDPVISPPVLRRMIAKMVSADHGRAVEARRRVEALTEPERKLLTLLAAGSPNAEIAGQLFVSLATVKTYVSRLLAKLGVSNRTQAAILAHDAGLT